MRTDLQCKADKKGVLQTQDLVNETLSSLSKELLVKANLTDVTALLEKKVNAEELGLELGALKQGVNRLIQEVSKHSAELTTRFEEQQALNEVLCAENCVARWLWKHGQTLQEQVSEGALQNGLIRWDLESVNTCPENY